LIRAIAVMVIGSGASVAMAGDAYRSSDYANARKEAATITEAADSKAGSPKSVKSEDLELVRPVMLDAAAEEKPNIHGFASVTTTTSYITPRGLVVENQGVVTQPIVGLVVPIGDVGFMKKLAVVGGIWNCYTFNQNDTHVGAWNEMDLFFGFGFEIVDKLHFDVTYGLWSFPQSQDPKPDNEHVIDFKFSYDDTGMFVEGFGLHPYVDIFYAIDGSSNVVLGRQGSTFYVEPGIVPTFKTGPVTWTFPTYFSIGDSEFWTASGTGSSNCFGVLSTCVQASVPLTSIIPARFGYWHLDVGCQFYYLLNGSLSDAAVLLSGETNRDLYRGYVTVGMNF
jgi:hypothetical protein